LIPVYLERDGLNHETYGGTIFTDRAAVIGFLCPRTHIFPLFSTSKHIG
jgi:hypothetical protein